MNTQIKKEALKSIRKGDYVSFFCYADQLELSNWLVFLFPKKPKKQDINGDWYFKNNFWIEITKSKYFSELLNCKKSKLLFDFYFKREENASFDFNKAVAEQNPAQFIEVFKKNRHKPIFKEEFIESIRKFTDSNNKNLKLFAEFVIYLHNEEKDLWQIFKKDAKIWLELNPIELFAYTSYYIEEANSYDPSIQLYTTIDVLFSYYFFNKKDKLVINENLFLKHSFETLNFCIKTLDNKYFESLTKLKTWLMFVEDVVNLYLYYDNFSLSETQDNYYLSCIDTVKEAKWKTVGKKIELLPTFIEASNSKIAELLVKENIDKIPGNTPEQFEINKRETIRSISQSVMLQAMQYTDYIVNDKTIPVSAISELLYGVIHIASEHYSRPLSEIRNKLKVKGVKTLEILNTKRAKTGLMPRFGIRFESLAEFTDMLKNTIKMHEVSREILEILCFNPKKEIEEKKKFNRYYPIINIIAKPFFEINGYVLSLESFFGKLTNAYNLIRENTYYHSKKKNKLRPVNLTQKEDRDFEKYFLKLFSDYNFDKIGASVDIYKNDETGKGRKIGDIDVYIFHQGILMLIELKRTNFSKQLPELYFEEKEVTEHASHQLIKIQKFLYDEKNHDWIQENLGFSMKSVKKILPLIITTSMEHDGEMINGILKKSFWDIYHHIINFNRELDDILQKIYNILKLDENWILFEKGFKEIDPDFTVFQKPKQFLKISLIKRK